MEKLIPLLGVITMVGLICFGTWLVLKKYHSPAYQKKFEKRLDKRVSRYLEEGASRLEAHRKGTERELILHTTKVILSIILMILAIVIIICIVFKIFVY